MVLGIAVSMVAIYFHHQDNDQRDCFREKFSALTMNLTERADISKRNTHAIKLDGRATRLESRANNRFYRKAFAAKNSAGVLAAYGNYRVEMAEVNQMRAKVDHRRAAIAKDSAAHPIPAFPAGTCN